MQFRVPQNIAIEDRIVGSLTTIQFGIVVVGGMVSFFVFSSLGIPYPLNVLGGGLLAIITVALALGRFNDQPMYRFIRHIVYFVSRPKTRVWHKGKPEPILIKASNNQKYAPKQHVTKNISKQDISNLAVLLDTRGRVGSIPIPVQPKPFK